MFKLVQITIHARFSLGYKRRLSIAILIHYKRFIIFEVSSIIRSPLDPYLFIPVLPHTVLFGILGMRSSRCQDNFCFLSSSINSKLLLAYIGLFCYDPNCFAYFPIMNIRRIFRMDEIDRKTCTKIYIFNSRD